LDGTERIASGRNGYRLEAYVTKLSAWSYFPLESTIASMLVIFGLLNPSFLSWSNLSNVLTRSAFIGIISVGGTFVIVTGQIDLSVGAMAALIASLMIIVMNQFAKASREKELFVVGGGGMKEVIKRIRKKDAIIPVDIVYSPINVRRLPFSTYRSIFAVQRSERGSRFKT
jgi:ribose/xylose/arabinose/galactoside ABC-type transport system permease subunit